MRVLLLSDINSAHTRRWAISLQNSGIETGIFSLLPPETIELEYLGIKIWHPGLFRKGISDSGLIRKAGYLKAAGFVRRCIDQFKPDILHAHYASSYGLLASVSHFHPFFLTVWGSDVFDFPKSSRLGRAILKYNFRKADRIFSTGRILATEARKYTRKEIRLIPFGVDTQKFAPLPPDGPEGREVIMIGTIKALEEIYGIDDLIKSFAVLCDKMPGRALRLTIAGTGTGEKTLKALTGNLILSHLVTFTGKIPHDQVPGLLRTFDIFMNLSKHESFGVSVLEASSCGIPVVATQTGGLAEVIEDHETGILVPVGDPERAAQAAEQLIADPALRELMGRKGRERVIQLFDWKSNVESMIREYQEIYRGT